jgi:lipopolysaccharide export system permease protein
MRLLDRYLLRELLVPLAFCLGAFLIFYCSFDLIAKLHSFQEKKLTTGDCIEYYMIMTPELLVSIIIPVSLLIALLYTVTNLARYNEFTAMRAAGVSLWRSSAPYFIVGVICTLAVLAINEIWVPDASDKLDDLFQRRQGVVSKKSSISSLAFRNESDGRDWNIQLYNLKTGEMRSPVLVWRFTNGARREIYADSGVFSNGLWIFHKVKEWNYASPQDYPPQVPHDTLQLSFPETPELIRSELKVNRLDLRQAAKRSQLSIHEIYDYIKLHPQLTPARRAVLMTQFHSRIAEPVKCLAVVLISVPFGARSGRRNVFVGVAASIFICFGYFILQNVCLTLGMTGYMPPLVAAWLPNLLVGITGIVLISRVR